MRKFTSKIWGVLGKQKEYYQQGKFQADKRIVPLNSNPLEAWDTKNSRYRRVDLIPREVPPNVQQMDGINESSNQTNIPAVTPSPTPSVTTTATPTNTPSQTTTQTNTPTPSVTPSVTPSFTPTQTNTPTPSITPSSTPIPLPLNPTLWYDSTDNSTLTLINSGGTDYVSAWQSKGTSTWTLTGQTTDSMPVLSASTLMPGNPNIVRFTPNATASFRDHLQSFNNTPIGHTGSTIFQVWAKPLGSTYGAASPSFIRVYSGLTNGGIAVNNPTQLVALDSQSVNITASIQIQQLYGIIPSGSSFSNLNILNYSATGLNDKYIVQSRTPFTAGQFQTWELNQSAGTNTTAFTGTTSIPQINSFTIGLSNITTGGTITHNNSNIELCEVMYYNTELTNAQIEQVELYLKDKWRYDEWASPVPTATPTASNTATPTPSITPTMTNTPTTTNTPSPTPPFNPLTLNPMIWVDFNDASTLSLRSGQFVQSVSNKGNWTAFTGFSQTTAANQPSWSASTMGTGKSAITISNDFLVAPSNLTGSSWNTFAVMKYAGTNPFGLISINGASGRAWSNLYPERNNSRYANYRVDTGGFEYRANFTGFTGFNTTHVAQGYMSNTATTIVDYMTVNNSALTETITSNNVPGTGFPGSITSPVFRIINVDEFQTPVSGEIGEIYMFDKELTSAQQSNLINFLRTKWGIT